LAMSAVWLGSLIASLAIAGWMKCVLRGLALP
jgi:hypothetical protein